MGRMGPEIEERSPRKPPPLLKPARPKAPPSPAAAALPDNDLEDEGLLRGLSFDGLDLSGRKVAGVDFERCRMKDTSLNDSALDRSTFADCTVEQGNWANLKTYGSSLIRVEFVAVRLTGMVWSSGGLRDVRFSNCRADLSSFRFSRLTTVVFEGCNLRQADFQDADLKRTHFIDCDLMAAQFSNAQMRGARFSNCLLDGIGGITSFGGARIDSPDLMSLTRTLASALGIILAED
jgi:uncharacterized protein YjbI with pentapeptide repeats